MYHTDISTNPVISCSRPQFEDMLQHMDVRPCVTAKTRFFFWMGSWDMFVLTKPGVFKVTSGKLPTVCGATKNFFDIFDSSQSCVCGNTPD